MRDEPKADAPNQPYCLLVSSCDSYADCWQPFFTLVHRHWRPPTPTIYLNTETKAYTYPPLEIRCPRVGLETARELGWGDRLLRTLERIPYDIVLYLQEDYFIDDTVDVATLNRLADLMRRESISHISLVAGNRTGTSTQYEFLDRIDQRTEYRISAQAGLWRTAALRSYLRRHETVWEFEWYGTRRARRRRDSFYYVNREYETTHGNRVIPYHGTGVVHGLWDPQVVVDLFAQHEIELDYSARGFYDPTNDVWSGKPRPIRAIRRLRSIL